MILILSANHIVTHNNKNQTNLPLHKIKVKPLSKSRHKIVKLITNF